MPVQDPTQNYNWNLPNDHSDDNAWGAMLRSIIGDTVTGIDAVVKSVSDVADAALARAGGTLTGRVTHRSSVGTAVSLGSALGGSVAIDLSQGDVFYGTVSGDVTFSFTNVAPSGAHVIVVDLQNAGSPHTVAWPASVRWPGGSPPTLTPSGRDVLIFYTRDGGSTWAGALSMRDVR